MNLSAGAAAPSPSQSITLARFLVTFVDQSIQGVLNQAQGATITLSETVILAWRTILETALRLLNSIAAPLIFPPPAWVTRVQTASALITNALQALAGLPIVSTRIFPPTPGTATVPVQTLRQIQANLRLAEQNLLEAERLLATPQR